MAGKEISQKAADVVFLQECETPFFQSAWNSTAENIMREYHIFQCQTSHDEPGTAVMVRKSGRAAVAVEKPICIGGTKETGGTSKIATVLPVTVSSREIKVVSTHFTWNGAAEQRLHHAKLLGEALPRAAENVILGGDFNCEPGDHLQRLEGQSFLGKMHRVPLPKGTMTGLSGDFSKQEHIDHVYVSKGMAVNRAAAAASPRSPYAASDGSQPAEVQAPSDHVPVFAEISLS